MTRVAAHNEASSRRLGRLRELSRAGSAYGETLRARQLAVARAGHGGPDTVDDLVRFVLADLDELV
jgi:hypothetical protein